MYIYFIVFPTLGDVSIPTKSQPNIYIETPLCWAPTQQPKPNTVPLPAPRNVSKQVCLLTLYITVLQDGQFTEYFNNFNSQEKSIQFGIFARFYF